MKEQEELSNKAKNKLHREETQINIIKGLLQKGYEPEEIVEITGYTPSKINMVLEQLKEIGFYVEKKERKSFASFQEKEKTPITTLQQDVKKQIEEGYTREEIAQKLKRSQQSIDRCIRILGKKGAIDFHKVEQLLAEEEQNQKVKELLKKGYTRTEIVKETGYSYEKVRNIIFFLVEKGDIQKDDLEKVLKRKHDSCIQNLTPLQKEVKALWEQGKNRKEIAKELGYSTSSVQESIVALQRKGAISPRAKKVEISPIQKEVLSLVNEGYTKKEIAEKLGMSYGQVYAVVHSLEVKEKINRQTELKSSIPSTDINDIQEKETRKALLELTRNCIKEKRYEQAIMALTCINKANITPHARENIQTIIRLLQNASIKREKKGEPEK